MAMYYYGLSVQMIQGYVFATNELQEIIGASEIIKKIENNFSSRVRKYDGEPIMRAAGNMKALFNNKEKFQEFLEDFSKEVAQQAYGLIFTEAAIEIEGDRPNAHEREKLEKYLIVQRNRPQLPLDMSFNITKLAPSSAKPAYIFKDEKYRDKAAWQKREEYTNWFKKKRSDDSSIEKFKDIHKIANDKSKIAVIHIDGNGLGALIQNLSKDEKFDIKKFSKNLDKATKKVFEKANKNYKLREVILGGDDVTVICDADVALEFTKDFLMHFEKNTKESLGLDGLTACAGIAYCHEKYPFFYAATLAEELCQYAKKESKKIDAQRAPSCVMFHLVQSSAVKGWEDIVKRELTIGDINCNFGPYYISRTPNLEDFIKLTEIFQESDAPAAKLREYLSKLDRNEKLAQEWLYRINEMTKSEIKKDINLYLGKLHRDLRLDNVTVENKTPLYDILSVAMNTKGVQ